tara:strand:- start:1739 stop:2836 length:1098 start_codon:yes stop_codon:yes gene_type:complete
MNSFKRSKPLFFYSGFIVLSALSIFVADNQVESVIIFSQYLSFYFSLLLIYTLSKQSKLKFIDILIYLSIISVFLESAYILLTFFDAVIINGESFTRSNLYKGFTANINIAAFSLAGKSPIILYYIFKSNKTINKVLGGVLVFMIASCLSILLSRGAFIAFALVNLLFIIYSLLKKLDNYFISSSVIVLSILLSYFTFSNLIKNGPENLINERIVSIQIDREDQSINERLRFYKAAFESIKENPILGIGIGNWKIESMKYDSKFATGYRVPFHAHNDFLQVAAESGLFASIFFILFLLYPFYLFIKYKIYRTADIEYFCVLLMMMVYILDTLINFPIARPISHLFLIFVSITLIFLADKYEEKNI